MAICTIGNCPYCKDCLAAIDTESKTVVFNPDAANQLPCQHFVVAQFHVSELQCGSVIWGQGGMFKASLGSVWPADWPVRCHDHLEGMLLGRTFDLATSHLLVKQGSGEASDADLLKDRWYYWNGTAMFSPDPTDLVRELIGVAQRG